MKKIRFKNSTINSYVQVLFSLTKIPSSRAKGSKILCAKFTAGYCPADICLPSTHTAVSREKGRSERGWSIYTLHSFCSCLVPFFLVFFFYLANTVLVILNVSEVGASLVCLFELTFMKLTVWDLGLGLCGNVQNFARKKRNMCNS